MRRVVMKFNKIVVSMMAAGIMASPLAHATNGYFSHGYGMKAKGMAGVGIALPQDSLAAATNPAGIVMVGNRMDVGVDLFIPDRGVTLTSGAGPAAGTYDGNGDSSFLIPEFGYNMSIDADSAFGVAVYGNGGMNTKYTTLNAGTAPTGSAATGGLNLGTGDLGVDLSQLFIAPTYARKLKPDNAVGVSLNLAYQRFKAEGLQNFGIMNPGYDSSTGWGVRIGWTGQVTPAVTLGATYATKTKMGKLDKYKGLFAEQGGFDIPANYGVGIAFKLDPATTLAADIQTIQYSGVKSISNPADTTGTVPLGADNGSGFGWKDMTVFKLGASHKYSEALEVRAGFSTGKQPIPADQTFFNTLAPGVVENHLTLGATYTLANKGEVTVGYMHAFKKTVTGTAAPIDLWMSENSLGVAYGWKM
jgi:long-chain fatty acid transport protein